MRTRSLDLPLIVPICLVAVLVACTKQGETPATTEVKVATAGAKCAAHDAPKELCFYCDASLREKDRLWCEEHGRYEDRCWECHPEARDKNRLYCNEHFLYEDECFICHPEVGKRPSGASAALICKEHGVPEDECGICHPELLTQKDPGHGLKIRLPSPESAGRAGVVVDTSVVDGMAQGVESFAEVTFDQNRFAHVTPLVGGVVTRVEVDLGTRVRQGQVLARVTSAAIGEAQSAFVKALAEEKLTRTGLERERSLRAERISSEKDLQEAEAAQGAAVASLQQARQQLTVLGFREENIEALAVQKGAPGILEVRAPFTGEIVERTAVQGALAETGKPLFAVADTRTLWAMITIPESQLGAVQVGQKVELTVDSLPGRTFSGTLTWLSAAVDEHTRMARGRAEVDNAAGLLKAQMFARARIVTRTSSRAVVVPQSALQNVSGTTVVFVKSAEDLFEARPVSLGAKRNGRVEILSGLQGGEPVVVAGSFALKSQFLVSRLGAGCVD